jgi:hypothetical protein
MNADQYPLCLPDQPSREKTQSESMVKLPSESKPADFTLEICP